MGWLRNNKFSSLWNYFLLEQFSFWVPMNTTLCFVWRHLINISVPHSDFRIQTALKSTYEVCQLIKSLRVQQKLKLTTLLCPDSIIVSISVSSGVCHLSKSKVNKLWNRQGLCQFNLITKILQNQDHEDRTKINSQAPNISCLSHNDIRVNVFFVLFFCNLEYWKQMQELHMC